jgi:hypothetical protein
MESDPPLDWALEPSIEDIETIEAAKKQFHATDIDPLPQSPPLRPKKAPKATDHSWFHYPFPFAAGTSLGVGERPFDRLLNSRPSWDSMIGPFKDSEEWELAQWLMGANVSQTDIDQYLKLPIVCQYFST